MQGFKKNTLTAPIQILAVVDPQVSFGCIVSDKNVTAGTDGKKTVKAGTPLTGDLTNRETAFEIAADGTTAVGVLLHDVDVTDGANNGTCLVFGWINQKYLDSATLELWTDSVKNALNAKVTLVK